MPPRHAYWTILIGDAPTAFRARDREELLPTFERLRAKQPDAVMRWFERGRLWNSPDEARLPHHGPREKRGPGWRPGGAHRDPRERFKGLTDQGAKGPRDHRAKGPRDQGARGPRDQGAKGSRDQGAKGPRDQWAKRWPPKGGGFQGRGPKDEGRRPAGPRDDQRKPWRPKSEGFQGRGPKDEGRRPAGPRDDQRKPWRPKSEGSQGQGPKDEGRRPVSPKRFPKKRDK